MKQIVVAIDGPAGAGKSTVARLAAQKLGCAYIDTGAMYRAVAWRTLLRGGEVTDAAILSALNGIDLDLRYENDGTKVFLDGKDVSKEIRTAEVTNIVSHVAKLKAVREHMVKLQRKMAERGGILMDGRDIATNVLPNADVKIYLTASIEERARRRYEEIRAKGEQADITAVQKDIERRDYEDMHREISPLLQAADATLLDTTAMPIETVLEKIITMCKLAQGR